MVRTTHLTPESLIRAMKRGDFYASSGVRVEHVVFDSTSKELKIEIDAEEGVSYSTQFVGSTKDAMVSAAATTTGDETEQDSDDEESQSDSDRPETNDVPNTIDLEKVGIVFATVEGTNPSFRLTGNELYVRAIITSDRDHPNPSMKDQKEMAWTQPVGWSTDH